MSAKYSKEAIDFLTDARKCGKTYVEIRDELRKRFGMMTTESAVKNMHYRLTGLRHKPSQKKAKPVLRVAPAAPALNVVPSVWRSADAWMMGDPPVGRSALDRRQAQ